MKSFRQTYSDLYSSYVSKAHVCNIKITAKTTRIIHVNHLCAVY